MRKTEKSKQACMRHKVDFREAIKKMELPSSQEVGQIRVDKLLPCNAPKQACNFNKVVPINWKQKLCYVYGKAAWPTSCPLLWQKELHARLKADHIKISVYYFYPAICNLLTMNNCAACKYFKYMLRKMIRGVSTKKTNN